MAACESLKTATVETLCASSASALATASQKFATLLYLDDLFSNMIDLFLVRSIATDQLSTPAQLSSVSCLCADCD